MIKNGWNYLVRNGSWIVVLTLTLIALILFIGRARSIQFDYSDKEWTGLFLSVIATVLLFFTYYSQRRQFREQSFETTFFKMIDTYNEIINSTVGDVKYKADKPYQYQEEKTFQGRKYFDEASDALLVYVNDFLNERLMRDHSMSMSEHLEIMIGDKFPEYFGNAYDSFFEDHHAALAHFYRFTS